MVKRLERLLKMGKLLEEKQGNSQIRHAGNHLGTESEKLTPELEMFWNQPNIDEINHKDIFPKRTLLQKSMLNVLLTKTGHVLKSNKKKKLKLK